MVIDVVSGISVLVRKTVFHDEFKTGLKLKNGREFEAVKMAYFSSYRIDHPVCRFLEFFLRASRFPSPQIPEKVIFRFLAKKIKKKPKS